MNDQRSLQAVESWARRDSFTRFDLIEAATGFPVELVAELEPVFFSETDRDWSIPESDVLLAAARMVGPQSPEVLRPILAAVKGVGRTATPKLDLLSKGMSALLDQMSGEEPHEQGYRLAARLRAKPEVVDDHGRVDPGELLRSWNVTVSDVPLRLRDIDAIGCWGPERGPTILINADHKFADSTTRRRATLAHEIAHLLVDRQAALPLAEVLGGRTSESVEKRARAFAAELLLPRSLAAQEFLGHNGNYADAIGSIRKRFGVSGEIIAWQVKNSESFVPFEGLEQLSELVPDPSRYLAY